MPHLTIATIRETGNAANFVVRVVDERHQKVAELDALSAAHARRVAADMVCLIRRLEPNRSVVLETESFGGRI